MDTTPDEPKKDDAKKDEAKKGDKKDDKKKAVELVGCVKSVYLFVCFFFGFVLFLLCPLSFKRVFKISNRVALQSEEDKKLKAELELLVERIKVCCCISPKKQGKKMTFISLHIAFSNLIFMFMNANFVLTLTHTSSFSEFNLLCWGFPFCLHHILTSFVVCPLHCPV